MTNAPPHSHSQVRAAAKAVQATCYDPAEEGSSITLSLAFTCVLSVGGAAPPALRLLERAGYTVGERTTTTTSSGSHDGGSGDGKAQEDSAAEIDGEEKADATRAPSSRGLLGSLQSKMRRFSGQSGGTSRALATLHQKLAPTAAARRGGGGGTKRDALTLSRLALEGPFFISFVSYYSILLFAHLFFSSCGEGAFDLRILVVRAEGLLKADLVGLSDPYVVVRLNWSGERRAAAGDEAGAANTKSSADGGKGGGKLGGREEEDETARGLTTKRGAFVKNTLTPTWNEPFEMLSVPPPRPRSAVPTRGAQDFHTLSFAVYDNDVLSADDVIGRAPPLEVHRDAQSKSARLSLRAGLDAANALCRVVVDSALEGECLLFTVTVYANHDHNLTRSP